MPKSIQEKKDMVQSLEDKYQKAKSVIFINFDTLTVHENESLRQELEEKGGEYIVAKKTLLDIVLSNRGLGNFTSAKNMEGKLATIFSYEDEVSAAKVVDKFQESHNGKIKFMGGILNGSFLEPVQMENLAKVPEKQELYAKIVGSINAPVSGFVNALAGNLRNLVYVLKAIEEKK